MLDAYFFESLEFAISHALKLSEAKETRSYWCDGIMLFQTGHDYSQKFVADNRYAVLKAFIGKDGQDEYELVLHFGNKSLSRYARALSIAECIPQPDFENCFSIDPVKKVATIQLD